MSASRFSPGPFVYNARVGSVLVPSLVVLAQIQEGQFVMGILTVGLMLVYMLDAMRQKEAALVTSWLTLACLNVACLFFTVATSSLFLMGAKVLATAALLFVTGLWGTMQFQWLQMRHPGGVLAIERLLLSLLFPVGGLFLTLGAVATAGMSAAAYYLCAALCGLYALLSRPLPSSFHRAVTTATVGGGRNSPVSCLQSKLDSALHACMLCVMPATVYVAVHGESFLPAPSLHHLWSLLLLSSAPALFLLLLPCGTWFLAETHSNKVLLRGCGLLAVTGFLAGLEGRVLLPALSAFIPFPPPWSTLLVSVAVFVGGALAVAHHSGALAEWADTSLLGTGLVLATAAGGVAAGLPLAILLVALMAAAALALFYETRQLLNYVVFAAGALFTVAYFIHHHHWFLLIDVGGLSLHTLCKLLVGGMVPAILVPGLVLSDTNTHLLGYLLLGQAALICVVEEHLFAGRHEQGVAMYPAFLVIGTTVGGCLLATKLAADGQISRVVAWAMLCAYGAKAAMLLMPTAMLVLPAVALLLSITPPLLLYSQDELRRRVRITPLQGALHASSVLFAVMYARFAIFDVVQQLGSSQPSEGLLLGCLVLATGLGMAPLVARCYSNSEISKRCLALVLALGALLVMLRPPLPIKGGWECPDLPFKLCPRLWDERHMVRHETDDVAIWGEGFARREHWPLWLLLGAGVSGAAAATATPSSWLASRIKAAAAALSAVLLGGYLAQEFFSGQTALQACVMVAALSAGSFLNALHQPSGTATGAGAAPLLLAVWGASLPAALIFQLEGTLPPLPQEARRLFPDAAGEDAVARERAGLRRVSLLLAYAAMGLLLALSIKLKLAAAVRRKTAAGTGAGAYRASAGGGRAGSAVNGFLELIPGGTLAAVGKMLKLDAAGEMRLSRLAGQGLGWAPSACNAVTCTVFLIGLVLNTKYDIGGDAGVLAVAPVLLLLTQDSLLLRGLGDNERYSPPCLAVSLFLAASGVGQIAELLSPATLAAVVGTPASHYRSVAKTALMLAATLPNHWMFNRYMMTHQRSSQWQLLGVAPLNALGLLFGALPAVRLLAATALVMVCAQTYDVRRVRRRGMKLI